MALGGLVEGRSKLRTLKEEGTQPCSRVIPRVVNDKLRTGPSGVVWETDGPPGIETRP